MRRPRSELAWITLLLILGAVTAYIVGIGLAVQTNGPAHSSAIGEFFSFEGVIDGTSGERRWPGVFALGLVGSWDDEPRHQAGSLTDGFPKWVARPSTTVRGWQNCETVAAGWPFYYLAGWRTEVHQEDRASPAISSQWLVRVGDQSSGEAHRIPLAVLPLRFLGATAIYSMAWAWVASLFYTIAWLCSRRRRRLSLRSFTWNVCLPASLIGLLCSVLVGLGSAALDPTEWDPGRYTYLAEDELPKAVYECLIDRRLLYSTVTVIGSGVPPTDRGAIPGWADLSIDASPTGEWSSTTWAAGWPLRCLRGWSHGDDRDTGVGLVEVSDPSTGNSTVIPLLPIPLGIVVNTLTFGLLLTPLLATTVLWRRNCRLKAGLCGRCGYDLTEAADKTVCPECGSSRMAPASRPARDVTAGVPDSAGN